MEISVIVFSVLYIMLLIKSITVGSSCNLHKYWTNKEYKAKYDVWLNDLPK